MKVGSMMPSRSIMKILSWLVNTNATSFSMDLSSAFASKSRGDVKIGPRYTSGLKTMRSS